jgi:hypothetical protein
MEILVFAFVAGFNLYRAKEKFVPEPYPFQRFDVQTLKQVYNARVESSNSPSDRQRSYAVQAVS